VVQALSEFVALRVATNERITSKTKQYAQCHLHTNTSHKNVAKRFAGPTIFEYVFLFVLRPLARGVT
jgi:hypothetical protein